MEELQIFDNAEFGQIRTITKDNEPMFCLMDICKALGMKNATMVASRLEDDEVTKLDLGSQNGETNFVTESGLYAVVLRSDKPNAKKFRKWVTSEVLPTIRKTGSYHKPLTAIEQLQLTQQAVLEVKEQIDNVNKDLQDFKQDLPLLAVECERITRAVRVKGMEVLGGKDSNAYHDKSLRSKAYSDIHNEVKRQFGVATYKAIKRSQCQKAVEIINNYQLPLALAEEVKNCNAQMKLKEVV